MGKIGENRLNALFWGKWRQRREMEAKLRRQFQDLQIREYDDKDLTITESLYFDLRAFEQRCEENGIAYQHFVDWHGTYDLPMLEALGFIRWVKSLPPRNLGWRKYFPEQPYELTTKARVVLSNPGKYIVHLGADV